MNKQLEETQIRGLLGDKRVTTLGERIAAGRKIRDWDQTQLAKKMGVSKASVSDWESGKIKNLRLANIFKLADVLEVNARWLAIGAGSPVRRILGEEDEHSLIDLYRGMTDKTKADLLATARALNARDAQTPSRRNPYPAVA